MTTGETQREGRRLVTGVFAKRPRQGEVKTRLEPALGGAGAAAFARALLDDAARRLDEPDLGLELVFAPAEERDWFAMCFPGYRLTAQRGAGLAARLEHWFAGCLGGRVSAAGVGPEAVEGAGQAPLQLAGQVPPHRRAELAIAVGSDSPWTSAARVRAAADLLEAGKDVVLGPDLGGGYYLVGLRCPQPGLFTDITMSTRSMFRETLAWLDERDLSYALLEEDYDVDTPEDLRHLRHELAEVLPEPDEPDRRDESSRGRDNLSGGCDDMSDRSDDLFDERDGREAPEVRNASNDPDGPGEQAAARGTHRPNPDDPSWPHAVAACLKALGS